MSTATAFGSGESGAGGRSEKGGRAAAAGAAFLVALALLAAGPAAGQTKSLEARPTAEPIVLDGVLDEKAWLEAPVGSGFVQREPDTGRPPSQRTEVRVVYSPTPLYIGLSCFDDQ